MSLGYRSWLLTGVAWFFEAFGWGAFILLKGDGFAFVLYYVLHGLAAMPLYLLIYRKLHRRYEGQQVWLYLFVTLVLVCVPFVSIYGLSLGFVWATLTPYEKKRQDPWDVLDIPELPYRVISMGAGTIVSFASLRQILDAALDTDKRLKAIMLSRQLPEKERIRLLQKALTDPDDEVRLLAYSLLEDREKEISEKIIRLQQRLKADLTVEERRQTLFGIAQSFWDMAYLGIAQQDLKRYFLREAEKYLNMLLEIEERGAPWFLLGRVQLHEARYRDAENAFNRAIQLGVSEREVLPWLAEAVFYQGRYREVSRLLTRYRSLGKVIAPLQPVIQYWLTRRAVPTLIRQAQ